MSKIPLSRFDYENGSASFFGTDVTSMARDEINFGRYVTRLRNTFGKIILKPLQIQLALDIPELRDATEVLDAVQLRWNSYNLFEELFEQEVMQKRVEFIQTMKESLVDMDTEGNELKFFSSEFLVRKFLKLSETDLRLNKKLKEEENEENKEFSTDTEDGEGSEGMGMEADKETKKEKREIIKDVPDLDKGRPKVYKQLISDSKDGEDSEEEIKKEKKEKKKKSKPKDAEEE